MPVDPLRVEVWDAMAEQFLDTERRQDIPMTAWRCVVAGLSGEAAAWVWDHEVTPAVGFNLEEIAGEWGMWDRDWLVARIEAARAAAPPAERALAGVWSAIERCIDVLAAFPTPAACEQAANDLWAMARHWYDFVPPVPDAAQRDRLRALDPEPFRRIVEPATSPSERAAAGRRLDLLLARPQHLRERLRDALAAAGAVRSGDTLFDELVARYREPQRHYHDLDHIAATLVALDRHRAAAERPAEVELALWFHDAVYDPVRGDNEQRSAALARERLAALGLSDDGVERVARAVEATADHAAAAGDAALVNDLDLSILGAPAAAYDAFERQIRREYAHVPEPLFRAGRARILQGFLDRPTLYVTPSVRAELDAPARANLARRIRELEQR